VETVAWDGNCQILCCEETVRRVAVQPCIDLPPDTLPTPFCSLTPTGRQPQNWDKFYRLPPASRIDASCCGLFKSQYILLLNVIQMLPPHRL
jgi:hypothetical protein